MPVNSSTCAAAHDLHVKVTHAERAPRGLADRGECLGHQRLEGLPALAALLEFVGKPAQLLVGHLLVGVLQGVRQRHHLLQAAQFAPFTHADDPIQKCHVLLLAYRR